MCHLRLLLLVFLLIACSSQTLQTDTELLYGEASSSNIDGQSIQNALTRHSDMALSGYSATAYPITPALIKITEQEKGFSEKLSSSIINKNIAEKLKTFTENKLCFHFIISSKIDNEEQVQFSNWGAILKDDRGIPTKIEWSPESIESKPTSEQIPSYYGKSNKWKNHGIGCSGPIKMEEGFSLTLTPLKAPFHLSTPILLEWSFDKFQVIDGKKVKVPASQKRQQPYRSW